MSEKPAQTKNRKEPGLPFPGGGCFVTSFSRLNEIGAFVLIDHNVVKPDGIRKTRTGSKAKQKMSCYQPQVDVGAIENYLLQRS